MLFRSQVDGFSGDHSGYRTGGGVDEHSLSQEDLQVPSADRIHSQKAVAVNVADNKSDLITVSIEEDCASTGGVDDSMQAAVDICRDAVSKL